MVRIKQFLGHASPLTDYEFLDGRLIGAGPNAFCCRNLEDIMRLQLEEHFLLSPELFRPEVSILEASSHSGWFVA